VVLRLAQLPVPLVVLSLVARPEQPLAQLSARSLAELLTIRVRDFAYT
jgi:hypothetical protein